MGVQGDDIFTTVEVFLSGVEIFEVAVAVEVIEEFGASFDDFKCFCIDNCTPDVLFALDFVNNFESAFRLTLYFAKSGWVEEHP